MFDKLRRHDVHSKQTRLDEKMTALDEDIQRMKATRRRLERDQRAAETTESEAQGANERRANAKSPFSMPTWMILASVGALLFVLIIIYTALMH